MCLEIFHVYLQVFHVHVQVFVHVEVFHLQVFHLHASTGLLCACIYTLLSH